MGRLNKLGGKKKAGGGVEQEGSGDGGREGGAGHFDMCAETRNPQRGQN